MLMQSAQCLSHVSSLPLNFIIAIFINVSYINSARWQAYKMPGTMLKSEDKSKNKSNNLVKKAKKLKIVVKHGNSGWKKIVLEKYGKLFPRWKVGRGKRQVVKTAGAHTKPHLLSAHSPWLFFPATYNCGLKTTKFKWLR